MPTTDATFAERYRAVSAKDARFDGQFVLAVSTTRIYCRPSCPARTPKPENVTFYEASAAAHAAGYRACKRCLPEAAPGSPHWNIRGDIAARAMRLIADGVVDREGVPGLASRLGYSTRQLGRVLQAELGATPVALARAQRAQTARALLVETELPVSDIAFAAGFGSLRQCTDTVREVFDVTPSALRQRARHVRRAPGEPVRLSVTLPVRRPFDADGVFAFLAARAITGVELVERTEHGWRFARTLRLPHGPGAAEVTANGELRVRLELTDVADAAPAVARLRRLLDVDADPIAIDQALATDPALAASVRATPGIRVPGTVDAHEMVVRAIVGQQISVAAARTQLSRLAERLGTPYRSGFEGLSLLFPTADQIAHGARVDDGPLDPDRVLRLPRAVIRTITETCAALASGDLCVDVGADAAALRAALVARRGIGEWTAAYLVLRVLGDPDVWMTGDVALVAGARVLGVLDAAGAATALHRPLSDRARDWAPWRSYAAMHVWRAATPIRKASR